MKFVRIFLQVFSVFFAFMPQDEARAGVIERTDQISSLSADEILEKVKAAKNSLPVEGQHFKYLREANIYDLKKDGSIREKNPEIIPCLHRWTGSTTAGNRR